MAAALMGAREDALAALVMAAAQVAVDDGVARRVLAALEAFGVCPAAPGGQLALDGSAAPAVAEQPAEQARQRLWAAEAMDVFRYWQRATGHEKARYTPERRTKIVARLKEGYDVRTIKRAIDGCAASEFHGGGNDRGERYDDITLICRTGSKLEQFASRVEPDAEPAHDREASEDPRERALRERMERARKAGDRGEYEQANEELGRLLQGRDRGPGAGRDRGPRPVGDAKG